MAFFTLFWVIFWRQMLRSILSFVKNLFPTVFRYIKMSSLILNLWKIFRMWTPYCQCQSPSYKEQDHFPHSLYPKEQCELLASGIFYSFQIFKERRVEYYLLGHVIFLIRSIKDVNDFFDSSTDCFDIFKWPADEQWRENQS